VSRPALGPSEPPIQWIPGVIYPRIKGQGCEADHSPPSSDEVKNAWRYTILPPYVFTVWCLIMQWMSLWCGIEPQGQFYFALHQSGCAISYQQKFQLRL
jgi:hypothetical protein